MSCKRHDKLWSVAEYPTGASGFFSTEKENELVKKKTLAAWRDLLPNSEDEYLISCSIKFSQCLLIGYIQFVSNCIQFTLTNS